MTLKIHSDFTNQVYGTVENAAQLVTPGEHIGDKALIISGNKSSWGDLLVTFRRQKGKKTTTKKNPNKSGDTDINMSFFYYNTLMLWFKIFLEINVWEKYQFYATLGEFQRHGHQFYEYWLLSSSPKRQKNKNPKQSHIQIPCYPNLSEWNYYPSCPLSTELWKMLMAFRNAPFQLLHPNKVVQMRYWGKSPERLNILPCQCKSLSY